MKTQSFRFRGGVARVAAWHGRSDIASVALQCRGPLAIDTVEVGGSVHPLELGAGRGARLEVAQRVLIDVAEAGQNGLDPLRALEVAASGGMLGKPRICRYQQHEHRVSTHLRRYARPR